MPGRPLFCKVYLGHLQGRARVSCDNDVLGRYWLAKYRESF